MASGKQWAMGCGTGCLLIILLTVGLGAGSFFFLKNKVTQIEEWDERNDELLTRLGDPEVYTPSADGTVAPERLELFLDIRDATAVDRDNLYELCRDLPSSDDNVSFRVGLRTLRNMPKLLKTLGEYLENRNETLLDYDMMLGEYYYIHTMAYHWWLGHPPDDNPESGIESTGRGGFHIDFGDDSNFSPESFFEGYNEIVTAMLENQLSTLLADSDDRSTEAQRDALERELEKLRHRDDYVPWSDGLPSAMAANLEPWRARFEASYSPAINIVDLMMSVE